MEPEPDFVDEPEVVSEQYGCPDCGERRIDFLVWQDDEETVECQSCGHRYQP